MYYTFTDTPAGKLLLTSDGKVVTGIHWVVFKRAPQVRADWVEDKAFFRETLQQLDEYFAGTRQSFTVPYSSDGTAFQKAVWKEIEHLAYGKHTNYQAIAAAIGKPKAVRAVGTAVGSNPLSIIVPCHRVLTSAEKLGGYAGGLDSKKYLLERESISFGR